MIQTSISESSEEIQKEESQEDYKVTKTEELLKVGMYYMLLHYIYKIYIVS